MKECIITYVIPSTDKLYTAIQDQYCCLHCRSAKDTDALPSIRCTSFSFRLSLLALATMDKKTYSYITIDHILIDIAPVSSPIAF